MFIASEHNLIVLFIWMIEKSYLLSFQVVAK